MLKLLLCLSGLGNVKGDVPTIYKEDSMEFVPGFGIHGEKGSITNNGSER